MNKNTDEIVFTQPASTLENLSRLASKPGVQSTLILSKADGSIIRSTGLLASSALSSDLQDPALGNGTGYNGDPSTPAKNGAEVNSEAGKKGKTAEDVARMVFAFVSGAKNFAEGMDQADEVKLLRMRTRKNETVIVPGKRSPCFWLSRLPRWDSKLTCLVDPKFLLVVIHDTPPA